MILGDSSAWIDYLRDRPTPTTARIEALVAGDELVTTDAVVMEVLAGARDEPQARELERALAAFPRVVTESGDFEEAAAIYRSCRRRGGTPRSMIDCLIAAVAIRVDAAVLHNDRDFDLIAQHVDLRIDD